MKIITESENCIRIQNLTNFNMNKIINSGQCFRWNRDSEYEYSGVVLNKFLRIQKVNTYEYLFHCSIDDYRMLWRFYFDLDRDYEEINQFIIDNCGDDEFVRKSVESSDGIRILSQPKWETLVTFILSQQNNIPRIRLIVQRLCDELGKKYRTESGRWYSEFPSAEVIYSHPECIIHDIGAGFRDKYLLESAYQWIKNPILEEKWDWTYEEVIPELKSYYGVGDKIANCVALFAYNCYEAFPMDVWIKRIIFTYDTGFDKNRYGRYAGIVQQYMYYYARLLEDRI